MMNSNWMVVQAISQQKALVKLGYSVQQVNAMNLAETSKELKKLNYDFRANSPFKNR